MSVCREKLQHTQELQKPYHNKYAKSKNYAQGDKVLLNSKYLKTKQNHKLEFKFFGFYQVLHPIRKQAYKLELSKRQRFHDIFYVFSAEQDITKKRWVDKKTSQLEFEDNNKGKEYKVEEICNSTVYSKASESGHLSGLHNLIS